LSRDMGEPADAAEIPAIRAATESAASFGLFMAISVHKRPPLAKTRRTAAPFHESLSTYRPKCRTAG
jgi:hypothetical protein